LVEPQSQPHEINTFKERVERAGREDIYIAPYDSRSPELFRHEAAHLRSSTPAEVIKRIDPFGSTAVPGLAAKPVVDMLLQVASLRVARKSR
jgi:GrpB-like predicted nucleotidyltransferase (UPF0157 family)